MDKSEIPVFEVKNHTSEEPSVKRPRRAAACTNFREKSVPLSNKSSLVEIKKEQIADEEILALRLTSSAQDDDRPNRRLTDFILHDANGLSQPLEMLEVDDVFISGLILPLDENLNNEKDRGVRCEGFGRIESWHISGYEDGYPVIWISTEIADYSCLKPASTYKKIYDHFFAKASVCVEVYKQLSKPSGGNPDSSLDELLAGVVRLMNGNKLFSGGASIRDFLCSQGEFIHNQLIGLDETSKKNDRVFAELPVLAALRDECRKHQIFMQPQATASGLGIKIDSEIADGENKANTSSSFLCTVEDDEDAKLARLLQEGEYWKSMKQKRGQGSSSMSNKYYVKINEDEIANDYPLPAYYKNSTEEIDEFIVFENDNDTCYPDELPRSMLHDWSLYNLDSRLISLELLPMKPCADIDVTIFGSGVMTADDGSGFCVDASADQSSSSGPRAPSADGIPIYLSAIKEWMIEFGASMVFVSIRTDMAW